MSRPDEPAADSQAHSWDRRSTHRQDRAFVERAARDRCAPAPRSRSSAEDSVGSYGTSRRTSVNNPIRLVAPAAAVRATVSITPGKAMRPTVPKVENPAFSALTAQSGNTRALRRVSDWECRFRSSLRNSFSVAPIASRSAASSPRWRSSWIASSVRQEARESGRRCRCRLGVDAGSVLMPGQSRIGATPPRKRPLGSTSARTVATRAAVASSNDRCGWW